MRLDSFNSQHSILQIVASGYEYADENTEFKYHSFQIVTRAGQEECFYQYFLRNTSTSLIWHVSQHYAIPLFSWTQGNGHVYIMNFHDNAMRTFSCLWCPKNCACGTFQMFLVTNCDEHVQGPFQLVVAVVARPPFEQNKKNFLTKKIYFMSLNQTSAKI